MQHLSRLGQKSQGDQEGQTRESLSQVKQLGEWIESIQQDMNRMPYSEERLR